MVGKEGDVVCSGRTDCLRGLLQEWEYINAEDDTIMLTDDDFCATDTVCCVIR